VIVLSDPVPGVMVGPRLTCARAFADNDRWIARGRSTKTSYEYGFFDSGLSQLSYHPEPLVVDGNRVKSVVDVTGAKGAGFRHECDYVFNEDGSITLENIVTPYGAMPAILPRLGLSMKLSPFFSNIRWYGRGPHENYIDRASSALMGHYVQNVNDQYHYGYVRPQESGTKTQIKWMKVLDDNGAGFEITSDVKFSASVLPFSWEEMDVRKMGNNQAHSLELKTKACENDRSYGKTWVNFDLAQQGLGCINSWGAWPLEQHRVKAQPCQFNFVLRPVNN
jgi:beta-galactosidase